MAVPRPPGGDITARYQHPTKVDFGLTTSCSVLERWATELMAYPSEQSLPGPRGPHSVSPTTFREPEFILCQGW
jgi:hypothetical protein